MGIRKLISSLVVVSTGIATCYVHAETPAEQLTKISDQTAIMKARKTQRDAELGLLQTESQIKQSQPTGGSSEYPTLKRIEGFNGKLVATITFGDVTRDGTKGEGLYNGWKIISISPALVTVSRGKEQIDLTVSGQSVSGNQYSHADQRGAIPLPNNP